MRMVKLPMQVLASRLGFQPIRTMAVMKPMTPEQHSISREEYFAKNDRLKRPISPHLTIYKPQMTSMLSITHRGTGLFQSALLSGAAIATIAMPGTFPHYLSKLSDMHLGGALIFAAKFALAWPAVYHLINGVRHLAWDMGWGFQLPDLYKTGYAVLGLSVVIGAALAAM